MLCSHAAWGAEISPEAMCVYLADRIDYLESVLAKELSYSDSKSGLPAFLRPLGSALRPSTSTGALRSRRKGPASEMKSPPRSKRPQGSKNVPSLAFERLAKGLPAAETRHSRLPTATKEGKEKAADAQKRSRSRQGRSTIRTYVSLEGNEDEGDGATMAMITAAPGMFYGTKPSLAAEAAPVSDRRRSSMRMRKASVSQPQLAFSSKDGLAHPAVDVSQLPPSLKVQFIRSQGEGEEGEDEGSTAEAGNQSDSAREGSQSTGHAFSPPVSSRLPSHGSGTMDPRHMAASTSRVPRASWDLRERKKTSALFRSPHLDYFNKHDTNQHRAAMAESLLAQRTVGDLNRSVHGVSHLMSKLEELYIDEVELQAKFMKCATRIQAVVRGFLDRAMYHKLQRATTSWRKRRGKPFLLAFEQFVSKVQRADTLATELAERYVLYALLGLCFSITFPFPFYPVGDECVAKSWC